MGLAASITTTNLCWRTPEGREVLSNLNMSFSDRKRVGLVGRNGSGKTVLLSLLYGDLAPSSGSVTRSGHISFVRQCVGADPALTIADLFGVRQQLDILRRAEQGIATLGELERADWLLETRVEEALRRFDLNLTLDTALATISGGQYTRASLAAGMVERPNMLLLDEPTNNLDRPGREALYESLATLDCGAIVASHDPELLEHVDEIVELGNGTARTYGANWADYLEARAVLVASANQAYAHAERNAVLLAEKAQQRKERQARRDREGSRRNTKGGLPRILAGGRKNRAEKTGGETTRLAARKQSEAIEVLRAAKRELDIHEPVRIQLASTNLASDKVVARAVRITAGYDGRAVIRGLDFQITGPERIALVGANGSGKSTLFRVLAGSMQPESGVVAVNVPFALLDQHASLLDWGKSILENFRSFNPESDANACHAALAHFRFRSTEAMKVVSSLSGGQALLAACACVIGQGSPRPLLLLDEPTNHLDFDSVEALTAGLRAYDGAFVIASHDEYFLDKIEITRRFELTPTSL